MTTIERFVQLLNVRAPDEAMAQRLTTLVEEALRVATSSGDLPGRVLVIRGLDLDAIPTAGSPATIARAVDALVQRIAETLVHGDDPAAATAPMIYFEKDTDVLLSLAGRVATNQPTTEWFWPSIVKGWTPNTPTDRAITMLLEHAMGSSGGVVTLAQVVQTLASTGVIDKLLERLSAADGRALLGAIGWTESMAGGATEQHGGDPLAPQLPAHSQTLVQRWVDRWGGDVRDPRALWLGAMVLVADRPGRSTNAQLPDVVRVWLASVVEPPQAGATSDARNTAATMATLAIQREDLIADARAWLQSHPRSPLDSLFGGGPPRPLAPRTPTATTNPVERRQPDEEGREAMVGPDEPPTWRSPRRTNYAGLLFLIPLLSQTGLDDIVARDPTLIARDWTTALFLLLARNLGVPRDDPAIAWLTTRSVAIAHIDRALTAEVIRSARIRVRMQARLTMRQLVHRSGLIVATHTQVDALLQHSHTDLDIQRAGLVSDSTVVPWLGRVVQFHYLDAVDISG